MKIATFNVNNVNRRLPNLLAWLKTSAEAKRKALAGTDRAAYWRNKTAHLRARRQRWRTARGSRRQSPA
jgi:uncharacterized protein (DUF849 family)